MRFLCVAPATHFLIEVDNMDLKFELFAGAISEAITDKLYMLDSMGELNAKKIADTKATKMLAEIQKVLENDELDDFYMIDEIVSIFHKNNISTGGCHDFG